MKRTHQNRNKSGVHHRKDKVGCLSRKANRKAKRKKKKENMHQKYLQRFSKMKPSSEALEDTVQKRDATELRKNLKDTASKKRPESTEESRPKKNSSLKPVKDRSEQVEETSGPEKEALVKKRRVKGQSVAAEVKKKPQEDAVMARERKQLAQLEKQLKLKKRASLPKSFVDDGLDFLLDVVDSKKLYSLPEERAMLTASKPVKNIKEKSLKKESSDVEPESPQKKKKTSKRVHFQLDEEDSDQSRDSDENLESDDFEEENEKDGDEEMDMDDEEVDSDDDDDDDDEGSVEEEAMTDDEEEGAEEDESDGAEQEREDDDDQEMTDDEEVDEGEGDDTENVREDIYGRLVDSKGNLVTKKEQGGTYIPPAKRAALLAASGQEAEVDRLKKQLKGLLNRASESNMQGIANTVESLYMQHSRASVNQSLFALIKEAVVSPVLTPERLLAEMTMLVAILHGNVGSEVGAYFLQHVVKKYEELRHEEQYGGEHTMDNVVLLLCYLYNFKIAHHTLLFEVVSQLVECFTEKDIELLLLILKSAGFYLRRDDPEALGNQISCIQQKARELEESGVTMPSRARFMLEVLVAVRNNNVRRVPGTDLERTDRLRQLAGKFIRGGSLADNQLNIGLRDLLQAEDKGRWWIVGSAWEGRLEADTSNSKATTKGLGTSVVGAVSEKLVHLAKKLRINSDVRRSIFYILMSSEDYEDAFQKVLQLGLKGKQQQEMVVVAVLCCRQESSYNPYYSFFLQKLAVHERRFMIAIQFHMWDMFKTMEELTPSSRKNLAAMLAHLLASKALSLSVLKVLEFGVLNKALVKFLKHAFTTLLSAMSMTDIKEIFRAIAQLQKFRNLADGLRMFLVKHMKVEGEQKKKLVEACNELSQNHQMLM
ncbi:nucleolar MIF4G domain-containing protein 1-like [Babylonia areolata]|uniref:nucleolar MIF4G domain-containing protein 1-like n=1 Tax=Babylonia areolata TaxID=304850 RepID=UPI003FD0FD4F